MTKEYIEEFVGEKVKLTMIDDNVFEGILWLVNYETEEEKYVHSIMIDTSSFEFRPEHIKHIEIIP